MTAQQNREREARMAKRALNHAPEAVIVSDAERLQLAGWKLDHVETRQSRGQLQKRTYWAKGAWCYPQHLAVWLERHRVNLEWLNA